MTRANDATWLSERKRRPLWQRLVKWSAFGCGTVVILTVCLTAMLLHACVESTGSNSSPPIENPIAPPDPAADLSGGLDGFDSPYIGHTGSWDGKGGAMFGASKVPDLETEVSMGLRWTFMCVHWQVMEPHGPVDLETEVPPAWKALDEFVIAAHQRRLNILMQAPVVGGNAGGPPKWAGRRTRGRSAPKDIGALADFAGKLAERYCPNGTLAQREGWGDDYGVRAWELDNEPESYRTNWKGQAADYAEFAVKASTRIKEVDPQALILTPAVASGNHAVQWIQDALDADARAGSETFREQKQRYSIGPLTDVVSFHNYEGLDSFFAGEDFPVTRAFQQVRTVFEKWEKRAPGFEYPRKQEYWHTEGNYDFIGLMSERRRAAWRIRFFTRAFAAGIRKVVVMDAKPLEQVAVRNYILALPNPFPMLHATKELTSVEGRVQGFRHPEGSGEDAGQIWIVWAEKETGDAVVEVPATREDALVIEVDGQQRRVPATDGRIHLTLKGDRKMPPPILVVDRPR